MASTTGTENPGNTDYQTGHLKLIFNEGFSFSGYERDALYLNLQGNRFKDISGVSGVDSISDGRAAVVADFDNDGDADLFVTTLQGRSHYLYRNNVGHNKHFLRVSLTGNASGKDAFGTVVRIKTGRGTQTQIKSGGSGFLAQPDPRLLFGLDDDSGPVHLEVIWPSGKVERFGPVAIGSSIHIVEGLGELTELKEPRFSLPGPGNPLQMAWRNLKLSRGDPFPDLEMEPLNEAARRLGTLQFQGQPHLVNLWATYCGPCRKEMPELQGLADSLRQRGVQIIGLSLDFDDPESAREFADQLGVTYPLFLLKPASLERLYRGNSFFIPLTFMVDADGKVLEVFSGWSPETRARFEDLAR